MQIQISRLLKKPTDLDLHCLLRQGMTCSAREGLKKKSVKDFMRGVIDDCWLVSYLMMGYSVMIFYIK